MFNSKQINRNFSSSLQARCIYSAAAALRVDMRGTASSATGTDKLAEIEMNRDEAVQALLHSIENGGDTSTTTAHQRLNTLAAMLAHCEDACWAASTAPREDPPALDDTYAFMLSRELRTLTDDQAQTVADICRCSVEDIHAAKLKIETEEAAFLRTHQAEIIGLIDQAITLAQNSEADGWAALATLPEASQIGLLEKMASVAAKAQKSIVVSVLKGFADALGDAAFIAADIDDINAALAQYTAARRAHQAAESAVRRARSGRSTTQQHKLEQDAVARGERSTVGVVGEALSAKEQRRIELAMSKELADALSESTGVVGEALAEAVRGAKKSRK
jgi:hypothetical protein